MNLCPTFSSLGSFVVFTNQDNAVYTWGKFRGEGLGVHYSHDTPTLIDFPRVCSVSCGRSHILALTEHNQVYAWGHNSRGELGFPPPPGLETTTPHLIDFPGLGDEKIVKIACGSDFSGAVTSSGNLYTWGGVSFNCLGYPTEAEYVPTPTKLLPLPSKIVNVACGHFHTLVTTEDGSLYGCGVNASGEIGLGTDITDTAELTKISDNVAKISCGSCHSLILKKDGCLFSTGWNGDRGLGVGPVDDQFEMVFVMDNVESMATGGSHTLALTKDGVLWSWGSNEQGQLGLDPQVVSSIDRPKKGEGLPPRICSYGCGWNFSYVVDYEGTVFVQGSMMDDVPEFIGFAPVPDFKVRTPLHANWEAVFRWWFLGKLEDRSIFFGVPKEVIFHLVGTLWK
jgi:alpha-tubulin suppressor-like RCC1 family protein